jgi:capsular exopolysaccharide synthesis family protein
MPRDADLNAEAAARGWPAHAPQEPPPVHAAPARPAVRASPAPQPTSESSPRPSETSPSGHHQTQSADDSVVETNNLPRLELDGQVPQVEHSRHLALRLKSDMERLGHRSVMVASALRDEGKTTVSCNLAIALASVSSGRGIALVDLDLRNPSIGKRINLTVEHGIDDVILGRVPLEDARRPLSAPRIDVYPTAHRRPDAHEFLAGDGFAKTMDELHRRYELVVIDSPPTLLVPDSTLILRRADCCVTVAHAGITRVRMYKKMLATLPSDRILGKILNAAPTEKHQRDYYAYGYGIEDEETTPEKPTRRRLFGGRR